MPALRLEWLKQKPDQVQSSLIVGAGLLANAVGQSIHLSLTHRIREQARSHIRPSMALLLLLWP